MSCPARTYPLQKPEGHRPPVPRWQLAFDPDMTHVHTAYVGVQRHTDTEEAAAAVDRAVESIRNHLHGSTGDETLAYEEFSLIDGSDAEHAHIWVCYWTDRGKYKASLERLALASLHAALPDAGRSSIGVWCETFSSPVSRLETNYSGLDYLPGVARLPGATTEEHTLTAYWGAARDRVPDSAHDLFPADPKGAASESAPAAAGLGQHLVGTNADNLVHIRSGQFWHNCSEQEAAAYETKLEPTLKAGLHYLWRDPSAGAVGLRYLRNVGGDGKETSVTGFFRSLGHLEGWAKSHKSHLAIYNGAMRHAKLFGGERKFRTWHEVVVLKKDEAKFEYVNCAAGTGVMRFIALEETNDGT